MFKICFGFDFCFTNYYRQSFIFNVLELSFLRLLLVNYSDP